MTIDERLESLTRTAEKHAEIFDAFANSFKQIGVNLKTIQDNLVQTNENFQETNRSITELRVISEVHHFRIRKLGDDKEPTADIPQPKQRGAEKA